MIWYQNLANFGTLREKSHKCSFSKILIILQIKSKNLDHLLLIYDQLKKENNIIVSMHPNDFKINSSCHIYIYLSKKKYFSVHCLIYTLTFVFCRGIYCPFKIDIEITITFTSCINQCLSRNNSF